MTLQLTCHSAHSAILKLYMTTEICWYPEDALQPSSNKNNIPGKLI